MGKVVPDGTEAEEWKWVVDATKECFAHAQKVGVKVAIEPLNRFETYFFNRAAQALALADAVHPDCGVCLDAYHLNMEESNIHDAIRLAGKRLFDFHVADNNRFAAGLGHLEWPKIIATLREIGYDGALTNEFVAPVDRTPAAIYPDMVERNPVDISPEQLKFIQDHGSSLLTEKFYDEPDADHRGNAAPVDEVAKWAGCAPVCSGASPAEGRAMRIKSAEAWWVSIPIETARQHRQRFRDADHVRRGHPADRDRGWPCRLGRRQECRGQRRAIWRAGPPAEP